MKQTTFRTLTAVGVMLALVWTACGARAASIIWVTDNTDGSSAPSPDDIGFRNMLVANGHTVDRRTGRPWRSLSTSEINDLNNADLVIVSRDGDSGQYDDGSEVATWNGISSPLMLLNQYFVRSSRWKWLNTGGTSGTGDGFVEVPAAATGHDIFQNVTLDGNNRVDIATSSTPAAGTANVGNGQLLAFDPNNSNRVAIAYWDPGVQYYSGSGQTAGHKRMFFGAGNDGNNPKGALNLTAAGEQIFLDAIDFMLAPTPPVTLIGNNAMGETWSTAGDWSNNLPAHAGYAYHVGDSTGKTLRTPNNADNPTFPGDSLTIHSTGLLGLKHNGTVTVNDLRLDGGTIAAWVGNRTMAVAGNLRVDSDSTLNLGGTNRRDIELRSTLTGSGNLIVTGDASYSILRFRSNTAGYTGAIVVEDSVDRMHMGHTAGNVTTVKGVGSGLDYGPFEEFDVGTQGGDAVVVCPAGQPVDLGTGGGSLSVSRRWSGNSTTRGTLDLSGASDVDINVTNLRLGTITSGSSASSKGIMKLSAAGANSVKATTITVGDSTAAGNTGVTSQLTLGGAANALWADTMVVGGRKSKGTVDILAGGSVVLRNKAGTGRMDLYIGRNNLDTGSQAVGVMDLGNATSFDAKLDVLGIGDKGNTQDGKAKGTLTLAATNTIDANTIIVARGGNTGATGSGDRSLLVLGNMNTIGANVMEIGGRKTTGRVELGAPGGTLILGTAAKRTDLRIGYNNVNTGTRAFGEMDLGGGAVFNATLDELILGHKSGGGSGKAVGRLTLADANTIDARSILMGHSDNGGQQGSGDQQRIILGSTNTIKTDTFTISNRKSNALVAFGAPGGTLNLSGSSGARTDLRVAYNRDTGSHGVGMLDLGDGTFNASLSDLTVGNKTGSGGGTATGTVKHAAGTVDVGNRVHLGNTANSTGTYELGGTGVLNVAQHLEVGNYGTGIFTQTGGSVTARNLRLGYHSSGTGTYAMSGAASTLTVNQDAYIGDDNTGDFTQTGGAVHVKRDMRVGNHTGDNGTYALSGPASRVTVDRNLDVGYDGTGAFTQADGQVSVDGELRIAQNGASTGTYNLNGGRLTADVIRLGSGAAAFNFVGGTLAPGTLIGTTEFYGDFSQGSGGTLEIEIDGPGAGQYDVLKVFGGVTLAGQLDLLGGYDAQYLDSYVILENDGTDAINGIFTGLPEGSTFYVPGLSSWAQITYQGGVGNNDVVLAAVPEPITMLAVGLSIAGLGGYVRKRRRA